jgi:hypothetical protein
MDLLNLGLLLGGLLLDQVLSRRAGAEIEKNSAAS